MSSISLTVHIDFRDTPEKLTELVRWAAEVDADINGEPRDTYSVGEALEIVLVDPSNWSEAFNRYIISGYWFSKPPTHELDDTVRAIPVPE